MGASDASVQLKMYDKWKMIKLASHVLRSSSDFAKGTRGPFQQHVKQWSKPRRRRGGRETGDRERATGCERMAAEDWGQGTSGSGQATGNGGRKRRIGGRIPRDRRRVTGDMGTRNRGYGNMWTGDRGRGMARGTGDDTRQDSGRTGRCDTHIAHCSNPMQEQLILTPQTPPTPCKSNHEILTSLQKVQHQENLEIFA